MSSKGFIRITLPKNRIVDWSISPPNYVRYLYLATFLCYDGFVRSGGHLMTKKLCEKCMDLEYSTFQSFYKECLDVGLIKIDEQTKGIRLLDSIVSRDTRNIKQKDVTAILISIDKLRELYASINVHNHKTLSYMVRCLSLYDFEKKRFVLNNQTLSRKDCFNIFGIKADRSTCRKYDKFVIDGTPIFESCREGFETYYTLNDKLFSNQFDVRRPKSLSPNFKRRKDQAKTLKAWRADVLQRDNYVCQCCGGRLNLNAHHIKNYAQNKDLALDVDNGITLCEPCHNPLILGSFHNIYGTYNNNFEQLQEYIQSYSYIRKILDSISENKISAKDICLQCNLVEK